VDKVPPLPRMPDFAEEAAALPQVNLTQLRREHGWPAASGPKHRGATRLGTDSMGYLAWIPMPDRQG
jgi:hypothetical protein